MITHRCLTVAGVAFVLTWACTTAMGQEAPVEVAAIASEDWSMIEMLARELGAPGVVAAVAFWLTRSLAGWTPTVKVIHVHRDTEDTSA